MSSAPSLTASVAPATSSQLGQDPRTAALQSPTPSTFADAAPSASDAALTHSTVVGSAVTAAAVGPGSVAGGSSGSCATPPRTAWGPLQRPQALDAQKVYYCTGGLCRKTWTRWEDVPHWSKNRPAKPWCNDCGRDMPGPW